MAQTLTQERIDELLKLEKETLENDAKAKDYRIRRNAKQHLLLKKAKEKGIKVSDAEVNEYLKARK